MYCKKQIKQKAMLLSICSILGVGTMVDDHAMAMKSLKKLLSSVPSQEKIMKLARCKLDGISLSKSDEEKLNAYVNNIVDERGYIKIEANNVVNPIIYCLQQFKNIKLFKEILNWIDFHVPAAFTSRKNIDDPYSATPLFFAVNKKFDSYNQKKQIIDMLVSQSDINAVCKCTKSTDGTTVYITAVDLAYQKNLPKTAATIQSINSTFNEDVLNGNIEKIDEAVSAGANVNTPVCALTGEVFTPLEIALIRRDANMFDYLIQRGGEVSGRHFVADLVCDLHGKMAYRLNLKEHPGRFKTKKDFEFLKKVFACRKLNFEFKNIEHKSQFINIDYFENIYLDKELYELFKARFGRASDSCLAGVCKNTSLKTSEQLQLVTQLIHDDVTHFSRSPYYYKHMAIENKNLPLLKHLHSLDSTKYFPDYTINEAVQYCTSLDIIKYLVEDCKLPLDRIRYGSLSHAFMDRFEGKSKNTMKENGHLVDIAKYLVEKGMDVNGINSVGRTLLGQVAYSYKKQYSELGVALHNVFIKAGAKIYLD